MKRNEISRSYACPQHGLFCAWNSDWLTPEEISRKPCPKCGQSCGRLVVQPRRYGIAPAVHGDVRRPYYSQDKGRWITSKKDLREFHQQTGTVPLSDRDIKDALDAVSAADRQGTEELKWYDRELEKDSARARVAGGVVDDDDVDWQP